ncbi:MAG: hypothetical protein MI861_19180, partial [Pirellulales bacterium]|nr:hypothetical protein [Pirellulales bacterium]
HPYGLLSVIPPLAAIVLAIVTRRPVVSLIVGIFCGALVTSGGAPIKAIADTCEVHLWPTLVDPGKMRVFAFTLLMAAMVGVISRCGGMHGLIQVIAPLARTRRGGQLTTWLLGMVIFFDDYANTILLGGTLRPLCDRLKISREKLAYLVDSTAAPVASLALLSTWIAVEVDYIDEGISATGAGEDVPAMELFIASIPFRFYPLMALFLVPLVALTGRDFGPMLKKERLRQSTPPEDLEEQQAPTESVSPRWYNAAAPIALTLGVVVGLLYLTGRDNLEVAGDQPPALRDILGAADPSLALQYGALAGLALIAVMCRVQRLLTGAEILQAAGNGMKVVLPAIAILWCASALSRMTGNRSVNDEPSARYEFTDHRLYTGDYLASKIMPASSQDDQTQMSPDATVIKLLPTVVFVLAGILAFSTGTSFGTMGLLMPMAVTLAYDLLSAQGTAVALTHPILLACVASVLSGAVFGDHCSPISDTTILSSQACRCDHISHVVTQIPYALTVGLVSILLGTLPLGWGISVWILLPVQLAVIVGVLWIFGRKVDDYRGSA